MQSKSLTVNQRVEPVTAEVNEKNHLSIGAIDVVDLAAKFGTPLWIICEETVRQAAHAVLDGLKDYPLATPSYAGKAFLCLAMAALVKDLGFGIDVVSEGELLTALQAGFAPEKIFLHGNNKSAVELKLAVEKSGVKIVVDSLSELEDIIALAKEAGSRVPVMFRIIPGIELDTHEHIKTGHDTSKFGIPLEELSQLVRLALANNEQIELLGLHAHIGSQAMDMAPYLQFVDVMADLYASIQQKFDYILPDLDLGGGLGIAYTSEDQPLSLRDWSRALSERVKSAFAARSLPLPVLSLEPGRSIIGTAGVTIYQVGHVKELQSAAKNYLPIDGGMADNPRPITYQAKYTAVVANRMVGEPSREKAWTIVGRYCESGDIIVEEVVLDAKRGDLIAVYATGAYNYSMSSNYNRTGRPACVLVKDGQAEVILARETCTDLLKQDRMPSWLAPVILPG
ncbi:MAG: diaminopimelate decarboxylase [Cyanobacteria bacterium REEB67]|nr:diaminopimelate decarboxylase [Cyanobacteria bacterium REEB67]